MNCVLNIKPNNTIQKSKRYSNRIAKWSSAGDVVLRFVINHDSQSSKLNYIIHRKNYKEIETVKYTKINKIINFNYTLKQPIEVKIIKKINGDVIGDIEELELYSFGNDEFEVLRELNEDLTDLFEDLINVEDQKLGKFPKKWKAILKKYIKEAR